MDRIASSEFRKRFASLDADVEVTVNGHVIGMWLVRRWGEPVTTEVAEIARLNRTTPDRVVVMAPADAAYREFRPVPKPGKGK